MSKYHIKYLMRWEVMKMSENANLICEEISMKLKQAGYKLTPQREITVATLIEHQTELLTAEEIFMAVKLKNNSIGLATVYRTLDLLDELKIVNKKHFHDGLTRYDLFQSSNKVQPYYLVCSDCGSVEEIRVDIFENVSNYIKDNHQFAVSIQDITFHGRCKMCQKSERV